MNTRPPITTYRLQFNRDYRIADAQTIVDYLHDLGISDLYASPLLKARPGSTHGYDVTDPTEINPEVGTQDEFDALSGALQSRSMGLLLDIVPNHMAASLDNPWWFDVLEKGESSRYASFFDVDWSTKKVLLPILGRPYGEALEQHDIELKVVNGRPVIQVYDKYLPVGATDTRASSSVDDVLSRQHYRLAFWRKAADSINYRRFFDISDLVGLRAERDEVYAETHALVLKFIQDRKVTGLRIDHIDGLLDPQGYLDRLPDVYVVVEKILAGSEQVPPSWRTQGTTGYDFLNIVNGAFIDSAGYRKLEQIIAEVTGSKASYTEVFRERKRQVMRELFSGEVNALVHRLSELAEQDRHARDLSSEELREAFIAVTACLPVYRTYIRSERIPESDRVIIEDALKVAGQGGAIAFLRRVLLLDPAWYIKDRSADYLDFVMRWQQFTGPVMAKGLEDTTFYVHNPLVSINEVGGDSNGPSVYLGVEQFHRRNQQRREHWPLTMNSTSTHDTKRSEDVRARINVLSEVPGEWEDHLHRWLRMNPSESAPDANEQILIYQNMLGAWPIESDRLKQYVTKALREAKTHTSWINVNEEYEQNVHAWVNSLYVSQEFLSDFTKLQKKIAFFGSLGSLAQMLLKITSPGIPDIYRGTELWDLSLADPDNRRPVDFTARVEVLAALKKGVDPAELLRNWEDGRIKMFVAWKSLNFRRSNPDLFLKGEYIPLGITGPRQDHVISFARRLGDQWALVVVPRLLANLTRAGSPPLAEKVWKGTAIELPADAPKEWTNVLTGSPVNNAAKVASLFSTFPLGLFTQR